MQSAKEKNTQGKSDFWPQQERTASTDIIRDDNEYDKIAHTTCGWILIIMKIILTIYKHLMCTRLCQIILTILQCDSNFMTDLEKIKELSQVPQWECSCAGLQTLAIQLNNYTKMLEKGALA